MLFINNADFAVIRHKVDLLSGLSPAQKCDRTALAVVIMTGRIGYEAEKCSDRDQ